MMSILANIRASWASEMAQELPTTPTQIPQNRLASRCDAGSEDGIGSEHDLRIPDIARTEEGQGGLRARRLHPRLHRGLWVEFGRRNDGDDDPINRQCFAENNTDEIFGPNARHLDGSAEQRATC